MDRLKVYCDGAASNNGKENAIGGWACTVLLNDDRIYTETGREIGATNQMMELQAMIAGCKFAKSLQRDGNIPVDVYSDSAYIINCFNQKWWCNWEKNGWLNSKKEPVANRELWEALIPFFKDVYFTFNKVKGHSTDEQNIYVDKLAVQARLS